MLPRILLQQQNEANITGEMLGQRLPHCNAQRDGGYARGEKNKIK